MDTLKNDEEFVSYYVDGKRLAFCHFVKSEGKLLVDQTFVDESLRGKSIGSKLMEEVVRIAEKEGLRLDATCSYAAHYFEKNHLN